VEARTEGEMPLQVHVLSFEGPDAYARAGGIATRITGLVRALTEAGYERHLWFIGDPVFPGHENHKRLHLHRWCQWISRHHPAGVHDGEEGKCWDYVRSMPPFLLREQLLPHRPSEAKGMQYGRSASGTWIAHRTRQGGRFCASLAHDQMPTVTGVLERDYQFELYADRGHMLSVAAQEGNHAVS
jgi:hypothetical protein